MLTISSLFRISAASVSVCAPSEHGAIFLKMAHLENLIPKSFPHPFNVSGWDRQVFLGDLFNELNESEHFSYHPDSRKPPLALVQLIAASPHISRVQASRHACIARPFDN